jgi:serine/threonine protein kinase
LPSSASEGGYRKRLSQAIGISHSGASLSLSLQVSRHTLYVPRTSHLQDHTDAMPPCQVRLPAQGCGTYPDAGVQYRTGRMLGSGTYAIVREAIHIRTEEVYACKIINKKLMEGRENMVRLPRFCR